MNYEEKPFTREMFLTMTSEQIHQFWIDRQKARRAAGLDYQTQSIDAVTGEVVATIDGYINREYGRAR